MVTAATTAYTIVVTFWWPVMFINQPTAPELTLTSWPTAMMMSTSAPLVNSLPNNDRMGWARTPSATVSSSVGKNSQYTALRVTSSTSSRRPDQYSREIRGASVDAIAVSRM